MKPNIIRTIFNARLWLLIPALWLSGCRKDHLAEPVMDNTNTALLSLVTRGADSDAAGLPEERTVKTLRLMVFDAAGNQALNKQYTDAEEALKTSDGIYRIIERLPKNLGDVRICLVANEPSRWNLGRTTNKVTYAMLKAKYLDFPNDYRDFIGEIDTSMDLVPGQGNFVMFAETTTRFGETGATVAAPLGLVRTVAKVTLSLVYDAINGVDFDAGDRFEITSVSIENQPLQSYLTPKAYVSAADEFLPTSAKACRTTNADGWYLTDPLVFYIPEYLLSDEGYSADMYSYIQVLASYTTGGTNIPVSYRIPLGDKVQNHFIDPDYILNKEDYTISRNKHYVVDGRIRNLGEQDGIQLRLSIMEWKEAPSIDIDRPAPYLNVSDIYSVSTLFSPGTQTEKIFFWTNQAQEKISLESLSCTVYDGDPRLGGQFLGSLEELYPSLSYRTGITFYGTSDPGFFENNGYVDVSLDFPELPANGQRLVIAFRLRAGNLTREIKQVYYTNNL